MAKEHRAGDPWKSRLFMMSAQSDLAELRDRGFDNERRMHELIERNTGFLAWICWRRSSAVWTEGAPAGHSRSIRYKTLLLHWNTRTG